MPLLSFLPVMAQEVPTISEWWDFVRIFGSGAAGVLGPICWMLWRANREEVIYSRLRDKEMTTQSLSMTNLIERLLRDDDHKDEGLRTALVELKTGIAELRALIQRHLESTNKRN